ncbi:3-deoxy-manno-octulosonate cytidylyltransferase [Sphingomonas bacterium]|uniref:3-deoxy-manno-octulosonate cytidylyltransferase n=1 Tax=Sphingomonas bacterium TaxID=1895847 RepID=UPI0020C715A6|nr:manno-octulosonate cytidylyltransferase [Sphingomonas bacterium]
MPPPSALIVIPARFGSTRLPGKPLIPIAGRTLLERVVDVGRRAAALAGNTTLVVATDDVRVADHARALGCEVAMTARDIASGSGRAYAAAIGRTVLPDLIVNLQGDAPFVAASVPALLIDALRGHWGHESACEVATPVVRLDWRALDALREHKRLTPFSGTTCVCAADGRALWFSKAIIPAIRDEARLRAAGPPSPVWRHLGVYAYRREALARFEAASPTACERLEGLEQLRLLELGIGVAAVEVAAPVHAMSGIDTAEDVALAEQLIARFGDSFGG